MTQRSDAEDGGGNGCAVFIHGLMFPRKPAMGSIYVTSPLTRTQNSISPRFRDLTESFQVVKRPLRLIFSFQRDVFEGCAQHFDRNRILMEDGVMELLVRHLA